jgi:hypothetical protein
MINTATSAVILKQLGVPLAARRRAAAALPTSHPIVSFVDAAI